MRTCMLAAMFAGLLGAAANVVAGDGCAFLAPTCRAAAPACGCDGGDPGGGNCGLFGRCGRCGCGLFGHQCESSIDGLDRFSNCACKGSYNYPVPPLYTYHWPGMYKQVRMTDYHSPWRFPPLKRYEDEPLPNIETPAAEASSGPHLLRPVSLQTVPKATYHTQIEPLSSRLSR